MVSTMEDEINGKHARTDDTSGAGVSGNAPMHLAEFSGAQPQNQSPLWTFIRKA